MEANESSLLILEVELQLLVAAFDQDWVAISNRGTVYSKAL